MLVKCIIIAVIVNAARVDFLHGTEHCIYWHLLFCFLQMFHWNDLVMIYDGSEFKAILNGHKEVLPLIGNQLKRKKMDIELTGCKISFSQLKNMSFSFSYSIGDTQQILHTCTIISMTSSFVLLLFLKDPRYSIKLPVTFQ